MSSSRAGALIALAALLWTAGAMQAGTAHAFKSKNHVIIANRVLERVNAGEVGQMDADLRQALRDFPAYFRAGTLGPDNFPDIVAGQVWVHVDNGGNLATQTPMEQRPSNAWRSIDYGMYMLMRARQEVVINRTEGLQALAFAYGYLGHMIADGHAHSYVNEYAGGRWELFQGEGLFGVFTEEVKHYAVEGLLDQFLPRVDQSALEIRAPRKFLYRLMTEEIRTTSSNGTPVAQAGPAGRFGGAYYEELIKIRDRLDELSDNQNWSDTEAIDWVIKVNDIMLKVATLGSDVGNPIADVEHFFGQRARMVDVFLEEWIWLSECIAQNFVWQSNLRPSDRLNNPVLWRTDACHAIDFEPQGSALGSLYGGKLNEAAHGPYEDPGSVDNNLDRMKEFLQVAFLELLKFDPVRDIGSLNKVKSILPICEPLIPWGDCTNACQKAKETCLSSYCSGCPKKNGEYDCSVGDGRLASCIANALSPWSLILPPGIDILASGRCFACADNTATLRNFMSWQCAEAINIGSGGACSLCDQAPICKAIDGIQDLNRLIEQRIQPIALRMLQPMIDRVQAQVLGAIFGQHVEDLYTAVAMFKAANGNLGTIWLVNVAFLKEDLRAGGVDYLRQILSDGFGVPKALLVGLTTAEAIANAVFPFLPNKAIWGGTQSEQQKSFTDFVRHLFTLANDEICKLESSDPGFWLNRIPTIDHTHGPAHAFAKLMEQLRLLVGRPGPTATKLLSDMAGFAIDPNNVANLTASLSSFPPTANAVTTTLLSVTRDGNRNPNNANQPYTQFTSSICKVHPHLLCDGIASLDDPNNQTAFQYPVEALPPEHVAGAPFPTLANPFPDFDRSVVPWAPRHVIWRKDYVGPEGRCKVGYTAFTPATDSARMQDYLARLLRPNDCSTPPPRCTLATHNGHEYWFCSDSLLWRDARQACRLSGLDLARIDNAAENTFVRQRIGNRITWLGGSDLEQTESWVWPDQTQFWEGNFLGNAFGGRFTNWGFGEPNLGIFVDHCAQMHTDGSWRADWCGNRRPFVCETPVRQPLGTPLPTCTFGSLQGKDYWFCRGQHTRVQASQHCQAQGMQLVQVDSAAENTFLRDNTARDAWLGATDIGIEGAWLWPNNVRFWQGGPFGQRLGTSFTNWSLLEPNDLLGEDCAIIQRTNGQWNDIPCANTASFVCEGDSSVAGQTCDAR